MRQPVLVSTVKGREFMHQASLPSLFSTNMELMFVVYLLLSLKHLEMHVQTFPGMCVLSD